MSNLKIGKAIRLFGWVVVVYYTVYYLFATVETLADASVRVYAMLIIFEGVVHIVGGLFLVWLGRRIARNTEPSDKAKDSQGET